MQPIKQPGPGGKDRPQAPVVYGMSNLVVAIEISVLLGIWAAGSIGIWTFCLDVLAFETHCFHECILLSFVISA